MKETLYFRINFLIFSNFFIKKKLIEKKNMIMAALYYAVSFFEIYTVNTAKLDIVILRMREFSPS